MVKKAKSKRGAKREPTVREKKMGFFARHSDVLQSAPVERTRVKTFIVEKPIIIQEKPQRIVVPEEEGMFDSKKSRYSKKKRLEAPKEEYEEGEEELSEEGELGEEGSEEGDAIDDYGAEGGVEGEEGFGEEGEAGSSEEMISQGKNVHARSHGLFQNIWWKKAIIWAVMVWLLVLILELVMQALNLVQVDLTRQWWFLLGGFLVVSLIYFRIFDGKIKF